MIELHVVGGSFRVFVEDSQRVCHLFATAKEADVIGCSRLTLEANVRVFVQRVCLLGIQKGQIPVSQYWVAESKSDSELKL